MPVFDAYNLRARVAPVFVALIPVVVAVAAWAPEALSLKLGACRRNAPTSISGGTKRIGPSEIVDPEPDARSHFRSQWCQTDYSDTLLGSAATIVSIGLSMLVAQFGRNFGKRKEHGLWESWGGPPTTQLLRHRDTKFNPVLRDRYHNRLRRLRPDLAIPTPEQEARDPDGADQIYGAATRYLIGETRDTKRFPLVFKENVNYGFLRNLWGLKSFGLAISILGILACILRLWFVYQANHSLSAESIGAALISLALLLLWLLWVTPSTVHIAADAYAERLFEACEQI